MRRADTDRSELPGQDSFLDIVANIVGILILLVMVVGLRAATAANEEPADAASEPVETEVAKPDEPPAEPEEPLKPLVAQEEVNNAIRLAIARRNELAEKVAKTVASRKEALQRDATRVELATAVASIEQQIEEQRQKMGQDERRDFDLRAKLGAAEHELEKLTRERIALLSVARRSRPSKSGRRRLPSALNMIRWSSGCHTTAPR